MLSFHVEFGSGRATLTVQVAGIMWISKSWCCLRRGDDDVGNNVDDDLAEVDADDMVSKDSEKMQRNSSGDISKTDVYFADWTFFSTRASQGKRSWSNPFVPRTEGKSNPRHSVCTFLQTQQVRSRHFDARWHWAY